jgi:dipeptidyl aminopeptidase/acylaminoacyl peptidase
MKIVLKKIYLVFLILLFAANAQAFSQPVCRNAEARSTPGAVEKYVYKQAPDKSDNELRLALVRPVDNLPEKKRPLIIGVHGGGFLDWCILEPCYLKYSNDFLTEYFTPQGFLTASVQYRLTPPLDLKPPKIKDATLRETHYKAVQDVRDAIKFIFANAEKFGIDTENVFLVGTSAGAITVLHAAYLDNEEVSKDLSEKYGQLAKREKIKGVISLSGAIYDLAFLDGGDKVPMMIVHGTDDVIVPADRGFYLGMKHLTPVYGGRAIYEEAQKKGIPAKGFFYDFGHSYPGSFKKIIYQNAMEFIQANLACGSQNKTIATAR